MRAAAGNREISLGWNANSEPDLAGYRVYSSTTGVEPFALQAAVTTTRYLNTGLTNGITYFYYVRAYDIGNNESPRSNITNAIPYDITSYTYPITATCSGVPNCNDALGPPNGTPVDIDGTDVLILDFGPGRGIIDGENPSWDVVFYEWPNAGGIQMDYTFMDLSVDGVTWYRVFAWDGVPGGVIGTNIDGYATSPPGEEENETIPGVDLYPGGLPNNTGVAIDIGPWTPAGYAYRYVRFTYPGGMEAAQIDSVRRLH